MAFTIAGRGAEHEKRRQAFPRILDRLLLFTARGYFAQVMQLEHHHRYYRRWQEVFQVDQMYAEVRDEVREMHDLVMAREAEDNTKQIESLNVVAGALAAMIGGPLIVLGYFALPAPRSAWVRGCPVWGGNRVRAVCVFRHASARAR